MCCRAEVSGIRMLIFNFDSTCGVFLRLCVWQARSDKTRQRLPHFWRTRDRLACARMRMPSCYATPQAPLNAAIACDACSTRLTDRALVAAGSWFSSTSTLLLRNTSQQMRCVSLVEAASTFAPSFCYCRLQFLFQLQQSKACVELDGRLDVVVVARQLTAPLATIKLHCKSHKSNAKPPASR